jgi:hypothetical protein
MATLTAISTSTSTSTSSQAQLFDELSKESPDIGLIRELLDSGLADINATSGDRFIARTAYFYIRDSIRKNDYCDLEYYSWSNRKSKKMMRKLKAHFYPLLDILEDYNFNIMNGSSFWLQPDGSKHHQENAGLDFLNRNEFEIMAKYDAKRVIQFFDRLYFSKGLSADDTSVTLIPCLGRLMWQYPQFYKPELILYLIMKGGYWNQSELRASEWMMERTLSKFADQVPAAKAVDMIIMLQSLLGTNYAVGMQGANLRGFLAVVYGTVGAVSILVSSVNPAAEKRRCDILTITPRQLTA